MEKRRRSPEIFQRYERFCVFGLAVVSRTSRARLEPSAEVAARGGWRNEFIVSIFLAMETVLRRNEH